MTRTYVPRSEMSESASLHSDDAGDYTLRYDQADVSTSDRQDTLPFDYLVSSMLTAGGRRKQRIADEVLDRIRGREDAATLAAWTAYMILGSPKPGRVDDCVGLFSRLGPNVVRDAMLDAFVHRPPGPAVEATWAEDYWFSLVRSLGLISRQGTPETFRSEIEVAARSPVAAIREAAVHALADIADEKALDCLRDIATNDPSHLVRELAQEAIEEAQ